MRVKTIHTKNLRWIDIVNPEAEELRWVRQNFQFNEVHFQELERHQQRAHLDQGENYDYIVLLFPVYNKTTQEITAGEVDFFISNNFVLTAHYGEIHTIAELFNLVHGDQKTRDALMQRGSGYLLYRILESLFRRSYPILDHMNEDVNKIETKIFHKHDTDVLSHIMLMKKNVIEFRRMMKTHRSVLEKLPQRKNDYLLFPQSRLYYRDLHEYSTDIWDVLETLKETVDTLHETSQSIATHHLQEQTRIIGLFTAIIIPATLVAFLFGVGVEGIPFRHHPDGFWIVAGIMATASVTLWAVFKSMRWF